MTEQLTKSEMAHANATVVNDAQGRRLRLEIVDDRLEGYKTVCVMEIAASEIGEMLAGGKFASIGLWGPE